MMCGDVDGIGVQTVPSGCASTSRGRESGIPSTLAHLACRLSDQFTRRLEGLLRRLEPVSARATVQQRCGPARVVSDSEEARSSIRCHVALERHLPRQCTTVGQTRCLMPARDLVRAFGMMQQSRNAMRRISWRAASRGRRWLGSPRRFESWSSRGTSRSELTPRRPWCYPTSGGA